MQLMDGMKMIWDMGAGNRESGVGCGYRLAAHGSSDQPDDDRRGADVRRAHDYERPRKVMEERFLH